MKIQKEKFQFETYSEDLIQSLVDHIYRNKAEMNEVFFDGTGQSSYAKTSDQEYVDGLQKIFDRISPGVDFLKNSAELTACIKLKTCTPEDAKRLIGHYYHSTIYVPKPGMTCKEFAIEFDEKDNLKNFLRTARYKTLIEKEYHIEPESAAYSVKLTSIVKKLSKV
ncbi:hypothetical protein BH09BAC5_BH09BAC5_02010 [soil metagenome]